MSSLVSGSASRQNVPAQGYAAPPQDPKTQEGEEMTDGPVRHPPVVAVFGSTEEPTLVPAERLGKAVVDDGSVLLTGGGRSPEDRSVKEAAMRGAGAAGTPAARGRRVGVLGVESDNVGIEISDSGVIFEPGLGHGRNYLNAAMCDVAIAFHGGHGTDSEVAFALSLGRPVVLVGPGWETSFPPGEDDSARTALVRSARRRVKGDDGSALGDLISRAYEDLATARLRVQRCGLDEPADQLAVAAGGLAEDVGLHGVVPTLHDREDLDELAQQYRDWLAELRYPPR